MHAHSRMVAQTLRISPGSGLNVDPAKPYARPVRPAWSGTTPASTQFQINPLTGRLAGVDERKRAPVVIRPVGGRGVRVERNEVVEVGKGEPRAADVELEARLVQPGLGVLGLFARRLGEERQRGARGGLG